MPGLTDLTPIVFISLSIYTERERERDYIPLTHQSLINFLWKEMPKCTYQ